MGVYAFSIGGRLVHFSTYDALRDRVHKGRGKSVGLSWLEGCSESTTKKKEKKFYKWLID